MILLSPPQEMVAAEMLLRADAVRVHCPGQPMRDDDSRQAENYGGQVWALMRCPRCPAIGLVYEEEDPGSYRIVWRRGSEMWRDTCVGRDQLGPSYVGCGFDP